MESKSRKLFWKILEDMNFFFKKNQMKRYHQTCKHGIIIRILQSHALKKEKHCVKSVRIRRYSGSHFPAFELNTMRYFAPLRIQSKCGKMLTRITPNTNNFYAVKFRHISRFMRNGKVSSKEDKFRKISENFSKKFQRKNYI